MKVDTLIIGAGPAGLFCAEELLKQGAIGNGILIVDSGKSMSKRKCPESPECDCHNCDILEGVGGAGGFSDGKMTFSLSRGTQTEQIFGPEHEPLLGEIDTMMVEYGGPGVWYQPIEHVEDKILKKVLNAGFSFTSYPLRHLGSDGAQEMIINQEKSLIKRGVRIWTECPIKDLMTQPKVSGVDGFNVREKQAQVIGVVTKDYKLVWADQVVIATGLQGTLWVEKMAERLGIELKPGDAGIGIRLEAGAENLEGLFEIFYDFKLELDCPIGTLRSFCCNREGYIVNENHSSLMIRNVNGHSNLDPKLRSRSSNFAIIAKVSAEMTYPVSPQEWVRLVSRQINNLQDGMPSVQYASDFIGNIVSDSVKLDTNPIRTNHQAKAGADIALAMPYELRNSFRKFLSRLDTVLPHGLGSDAVVYAPEIKYYARRFPVDTDWKSTDIGGLYVIGNASGYLDSFVAAAVSGVIAAKRITKQFEV